MIDDYFPLGTFYKSTGDGLMVTVHFNRDTVVDMITAPLTGPSARSKRSRRSYATTQ